MRRSFLFRPRQGAIAISVCADLSEIFAAVLAITAFFYAGLYLVSHFNEAMDLAAQSRSVGNSVYYPDCAAARAAGAAPIRIGRPGYRPELDPDNDRDRLRALSRLGQ